MQLNHEIADYAYSFRFVGPRSVTLEDRELIRPLTLDQSFIVTPHTLVQAWPAPAHVEELGPDDLEPVLALAPELVILGTGETQRFPAAAVIGACLTRGIGIEVMTNAAAARTFNLLANESRKVVAAILLPG